jgi:hypothetical protein
MTYKRSTAMTSFTPYAAAKILNEVLAEHDIKLIPPQMVYNYCKKGYIKSSTVNGKIVVDENSFAEWSVKYLAKKGVALVTESTEIDGQLALEV